jgi:putative transposase
LNHPQVHRTAQLDWPHSSFHRDVRAGIIPQDWAGDVDASGAFGERRNKMADYAFG